VPAAELGRMPADGPSLLSYEIASPLMGVDWNVVSAIAGACGSLIAAGALIVAAVTVAREGKRWRIDREATIAERQEAERALASVVSAITEPSEGGRAVICVANDGDASVFDVRLTPEGRATLIGRSDDQKLGESIRRLGPRESVRYTFETLPGEEDFTRPTIKYVDGAGRRWRRNSLASPQRIDVTVTTKSN